ncbi:alpha-mannosidase 2x-like isoform X2 [Physella acuta]|uniref:alpha-mannosidase 2x-like isoform X2 n=1 Tax=Physella acuta TaxID=109671 RepID=UPI0027DBFFC1|nr:alpha-mannosidase 2x-like isoform X2 [Physella acuta]
MISRIRRFTFLWGALLFLVTIIMLYMMLDTLNTYPRSGSIDSMQLIESKIHKIETDIESNKKIVGEIRQEIVDIIHGGQDAFKKLQESFEEPKKSSPPTTQTSDLDKEFGKARKEDAFDVSPLITAESLTEVCHWNDEAVSTANINVHKMLEEIPFDNPDGGPWKQGWQVTYPPTKWTDQNVLKIILVPHTHCDPGWIKTFSDYYQTQTKKILDNFVPKLEQSQKYKFMFSEISYFSWWWSEQTPEMKQRVKRLIDNGQFEISTGGWVMTDEANAHYFAMLDQLIEGNQWLNRTLNYIPQSGWAVDPFGYSSTMAYLLKRSNFKSMLIQRVHYSIKKYLAKSSNLEFMWRQHWDSAANTDIFTHLMPFYSYDIPHTCGPDPAICCQFDFRRLPGNAFRCPWKIDPVPISDVNVAERTNLILDQWKKKATLYKTNVLLVPLGDDFRYLQPDEFDHQFGNYEKIFNYLSTHPELGAQGQFGTLSDYFNALYSSTNTVPGNAPPDIQSLSGDFFSYADRDDHYWTGYYTSRPLQKNLDRVLEHNLRSAEIIFSLTQVKAKRNSAANFPSTQFMQKLVEARRALALFQHHDAITGTAKDNVVVDYGERLLKALENTKIIITECSTFLSMQTKTDYSWTEGKPLFNMDELRISHDSLATKPTLELSDQPKSFLLYNSLAQSRVELVELWTSWPYVEITNSAGQAIHSQVQPHWSDIGVISTKLFKVSFLADMKGLSVQKFVIKKVENGMDTKNHISSVTILNPERAFDVKRGPFTVETVKDQKDFTLETKFLSCVFTGATGLLKTCKDVMTGNAYKSELEFIQYGTRLANDKSGAYLFLPDGDAKPLLTSGPVLIRVIRGTLISEVHVITQYIQHVIKLHNSPGTDGMAVNMYNIVDIRNSHNKEVGVRIHTDVENQEQTFYSDLNGFQMQKRKYYQKLTLQGNVYPMPTMAYLQDSRKRVSILSAQSSGVANLLPGALDVMFDRRLNQDDNRGLGQGVLDNKPTLNQFRILFETRTSKLESVVRESSFPSLLGQLSSLSLIHPVFVMPRSFHGKEPNMNSEVLLLQESLSCELHMLNLRIFQNSDDIKELQFVPRETSMLLLRHLPSDCSFPNLGISCKPGDGKISPSKIFADVQIKKSVLTSLTANHQLEVLEPSSLLTVPQMEIRALQVDMS